MCRSWGQQHSPSYRAAQYPFSSLESTSPTKMLYALSTLFLQSVQNLLANRTLRRSTFTSSFLNSSDLRRNSKHSNLYDCYRLPVFTQVCLQRLEETGTVNEDHLVPALLRHQLPHVHPAAPVQHNQNKTQQSLLTTFILK